MKLALLLLMLLAAGGAQAKPKKELRIGQIFRFHDQFNSTVHEMLAGMELAKRLFEKDHPGVRIRFVPMAHDVEPRLARHQETNLAAVARAAKAWLATDIPAAIGGEMSGEAIVVADLIEGHKRLLLTPTSTNPSVTEGKPYVFRACFSDTLVADRMARYVVEKIRPKALGVLHNVSYPYTDYLSRRFVERFEELAAKVPGYRPKVVVQKYLRRHMDFSHQVKAFQSQGVTLVSAFNHDMEMLTYLSYATKADFHPIYVTSDGWGSNTYIFDKFVKENPKGKRFVVVRNSYWHEESQSPLAKRFRKERSRTAKPTPWSAIGFDSAWMLFHAMDKAKDPNKAESIREALLGLTDLPLVTSETLRFLPGDNTPEKDLHLYRIDGTGIRFEETLR